MRQEASQPPLFYVLNGWATAWIDTRDAEQIVRYNPHAAVGTAAPWGNRNMIGHRVREQFPYSGTVLAVHLVRLFCVLMGAGTVLCTFAIARRLFPTLPWLAPVAAALNAFTPQFLFIHASVNNDVLVTLLSALTLWLLVRVAYDGPTVTRILALGIVLGLAALTKLSGLVLRPLTAVVRRQLGDLPCIALLLWSAAYVLGLVGWSQVISSQGRMLFPAMPAIAILLLLDLAQWFPARYARSPMTALLVIFLCLAAIVPYRYIAPVYARSAWTTDERQAIRGSLDVDMGGQVRLVGYDLSESAVSPGERLWVTLYWEALQTMGQDYSVFIHLVDDRGVTIVQCDIGQIDVRKG